MKTRTKTNTKTRTKRWQWLLAALSLVVSAAAAPVPEAPVGGQDPALYEAQGLARQRAGDERSALRAFTSLVDLGPKDAALLSRAGHLALRLGRHDLAGEYLARAVAERPDRIGYARGLALARWLGGDHEAAATGLLEALERRHSSRYGSLKAVLREEAHAVLDAWQATGSAPADRLAEARRRAGVREGATPDLRVILTWESEADDVDLYVTDPAGQVCSYRQRQTTGGVRLGADLSQGLGPEVVVVPRGRLARGDWLVGVSRYRSALGGTVRAMVVIQRFDRGVVPSLEVVPVTLAAPADREQEPEVVQVASVVVGR